MGCTLAIIQANEEKTKSNFRPENTSLSSPVEIASEMTEAKNSEWTENAKTKKSQIKRTPHHMRSAWCDDATKYSTIRFILTAHWPRILSFQPKNFIWFLLYVDAAFLINDTFACIFFLLPFFCRSADERCRLLLLRASATRNLNL